MFGFFAARGFGAAGGNLFEIQCMMLQKQLWHVVNTVFFHKNEYLLFKRY